MSETATRDRGSLSADLRRLGLRPGAAVLVHSSLRAMGRRPGGARAVVRDLLAVLGPDGTLMVPAFTPDNRDPSRWTHRPAPEHEWDRIRAELPPFDPANTPCREMGLLAETVRTWPGAVRSAHPQTSFVAVGARAAELTAQHPLTCELGEESPLGALEAIDGQVLLLGVGFDRCTAFHLAEYRLPGFARRTNRCVISTAEGRRWIEYPAAVLSDRDFDRLGQDFQGARPCGAAEEAEQPAVGEVRTGPVGAATARLFPVRAAVAFAVRWLGRHRHPGSAVAGGRGPGRPG